MSWAPGGDTIASMLDRRDLETVIASMDLANALLTQAEEAIDTALECNDYGSVLAELRSEWWGATVGTAPSPGRPRRSGRRTLYP